MNDDSQIANHKDRKVGLVLFGIGQLMIGLVCAIMVPLMILGVLVGAAVDPSTRANISTIIPGVMFYLAVAVCFIWVGIGSIQARRWARTIILVCSWLAFACGVGGTAVWLFIAPDMFSAMGELGQMPSFMAEIMQVVIMVFMICIYIVGPGAHILFYRSRHVKATCETRDSRIRWTDKCQPHVLALSFLFWMWGGSLLMMCGYNFALPFFGRIITGGPGALVMLTCMALSFWLAWGLYKLRPSAWWGSLFFTLVYIVSVAATFSQITLIQYYEAMNFPSEQLDLMRAIDLEKNTFLGISMLAYAIVFIGYIVYTRRFFPGGTMAFTPPTTSDPVEKKPLSSGTRWGIGCCAASIITIILLIVGSVALYRLAQGISTEVRSANLQLDALPEHVELDAESEALLEKMDLSDPGITQKVRHLLRPGRETASHHVLALVGQLMTDQRQEARKAAIDLLESRHHTGTLFVMRRLNQAGEQTQYFLEKIVEVWPDLWEKEAASLGNTLPSVMRANRDNDDIRALLEQLVALMIDHKSKKVPPQGIKLAQRLKLTEVPAVRAALERQKNNPIFDFFENEYPIRKAATRALGQEYVPPKPVDVDFAAISISRERGIAGSPRLTVGVLGSLYTATGPCAGGGDGYGWYGQCRMLDLLSSRQIDTLAYCHPITEADKLEISRRAREAGIEAPVLNAASAVDLALCDVVILPGVFNMRKETIAALEHYVWNGGGIITLEGAGIIDCKDSSRLAALQDMPSLRWSWSSSLNETCIQEVENPLTAGIDFVTPVHSGDGSVNRNGYVFHSRKYQHQVLLTFRQLGEAALRVSRYGKGRVAHFAWYPAFGDDKGGRRDWKLFGRVLQWSSGREYKDFSPAPVRTTRHK